MGPKIVSTSGIDTKKANEMKSIEQIREEAK